MTGKKLVKNMYAFNNTAYLWKIFQTVGRSKLARGKIAIIYHNPFSLKVK